MTQAMIKESATPQRCAGEILEVIPLVMRAIRTQMRSGRPGEMTVPQFRALAFVRHERGASVTDLAEFLGLAAPTASRLVDALVERGLVARREHAADRRRTVMELTEQGEALWERVHAGAMACLAEVLGRRAGVERDVITAAMGVLREAFGKGGTGMSHEDGK